MNKTIFVAGSGGIGEAAALLLREWAGLELTIILGDVSEANLAKASDFVLSGSDKTSPVETVLMLPEGETDAMRNAFERTDVLLDCSPGAQAPRMAAYAKRFKMHYANLTEYVAETDAILEL
ncbi:MAG: saccharopine dehydrogenase NADP-binding domain-containing protein, partial [Acidobacteria bacterium]|nr:saccharopine dehydrogenase NADP-binding domain-containing protein [Acidobacteriota bacterium]